MNPPPADPTPDPTAEAHGRPVDLAATARFRLGALEVRPSIRQVVGPDGRETFAEPRVLKVLVALAEADGAVVSRDALVQRCWEGRIVGEDAINRSIAKARHLAELADPPAFVIETIPRVGYRLKGAAGDGGPKGEPVVAFAPAAGKAGATPSPSATSPMARRALLFGGAAAAVAGAAVVGYRWRQAGRKADPLVAVLPFDNLSSDPQMGYFADGLSEDILNVLIRSGGVRVMSRSSSFSFRGPAKAKAATALDADYLLDGSVLRQGSRLRVNAHLSDVARRQTLWSESYDRDIGQGLQVEDEVAGRVAAALRVQFAPAGHAAKAVDPDAYDLYLKGRDATRIHTPESLRHGNELLRAAVARAPDFAPAWFELAKNYWRNGFLESVPEQQRGFELGRQAARRALALDPRDGAAYGVIAEMTPTFGHWVEIDRGLSRGLELSPNDPNLLIWRGTFLFASGRLKAALATAQRAQALDPLELLANHLLCQLLIYTGAFKAAQAQAERIAAIWPDQLAAYWDRFWLLATAGRDAEAAAWLDDRSRRPAGERDEYEVLAETMRANLSRSTAARQAAGRALLQLAQGGTGYATNSVILLAKLGLFEEALQLARALYLKTGDGRINRELQFQGASRFPLHGEPDVGALFHPFLAPLRRSGRLDAIFTGIGLTDLWRTAGGADR